MRRVFYQAQQTCTSNILHSFFRTIDKANATRVLSCHSYAGRCKPYCGTFGLKSGIFEKECQKQNPETSRSRLFFSVWLHSPQPRGSELFPFLKLSFSLCYTKIAELYSSKEILDSRTNTWSPKSKDFFSHFHHSGFTEGGTWSLSQVLHNIVWIFLYGFCFIIQQALLKEGRDIKQHIYCKPTMQCAKPVLHLHYLIYSS